MKLVLAILTVVASVASMNLAVADWPQYRGSSGTGKVAGELKVPNWNQATPQVLWKTETPLGFSSFAVSEGRAFTLVGEDADGQPREVCLALDAATGEELWSVPLGDRDYGHDGGNAGAKDNRGGDGPRGTPTTDGSHVYVYDAHLVLSCLDSKTGEVVWQTDVVEDYDGRNIKWLNATSPVLREGVLYVGGGGPGQSFLAINKQDGSLIWKSGDELITHATPAYATINGVDQLVYFVQSGLVSVAASTGKELWRTSFPFSVSTAASPVVDGDLVYCSAGYGVGAGLFRATGDIEA
ncbi:MAG: PQQ-binding-like beta-propeller repeat protein, partial [Planctomycetota bacterium]